MIDHAASACCAALVAALGGALLSSGCASPQAERLADDDFKVASTGKRTSWNSQIAADSLKSPERAVSFTAPQADAPQPKPGNRNLMMIALYGELEGTSKNAGAPFDGDSNLAQVSFANEGSCVDPDVDRTGMWLAFASTMHRKTADIYIKPVRGKTQTQITTDPADDVMPAFSPDGKNIAFASNRSGNWDVYLTTTDGGSAVQITNDADHELHPSWSPDGKMLVYCKFGSQSARWEMWVVDVTKPGVRHFLEYGVFPQWCPDVTRNKILFQRAKQRGSRDYSVWTIDFSGGQAIHPTEIVSAANAALINPAWSPDGSRIVFVTVIEPQHASSEKPAQSDIWLVNLDGTGRMALTNGQFANFQPIWAGDGAVYFVSDRSGVDNIWAVATARSLINSAPGASGVAAAEGGTRETRP